MMATRQAVARTKRAHARPASIRTRSPGRVGSDNLVAKGYGSRKRAPKLALGVSHYPPLACPRQLQTPPGKQFASGVRAQKGNAIATSLPRADQSQSSGATRS